MVFVFNISEILTLIGVIFGAGVSVGYIVTKVNILWKKYTDNTKR